MADLRGHPHVPAARQLDHDRLSSLTSGRITVTRREGRTAAGVPGAWVSDAPMFVPSVDPGPPADGTCTGRDGTVPEKVTPGLQPSWADRRPSLRGSPMPCLGGIRPAFTVRIRTSDRVRPVDPSSAAWPATGRVTRVMPGPR